MTLVHEFQHSKLSAMLDLVPLTDPDDHGRYFAPWRVDPRPLAGLLQGVYAFVGRRRHVACPAGRSTGRPSRRGHSSPRLASRSTGA